METKLLTTIALSLALAVTAHAQNSWKTGNGKWETAGNWSGGAPSSFDSFDFITNSTSKTVTIDATTTNTPSTMTINYLTISAPGGSTNTLSLNNAGTATPLYIQNDFTITAGGALVITNSALQNDGIFTIDGGQATFLSDSLNAFNNTTVVGFTPGSSGTVTFAGGTNELVTFDIGSYATGTVWVTDGELDGFNITIGRLGSLIQSNGTVTTPGLIDGGTLTVAGGTNVLGSLPVWASFSLGKTAAVWVTGGQLRVVPFCSTGCTDASINIGSNDVGFVTSGFLTQSNGMVQASQENVESGTLTIAGGTHIVGYSGLHVGLSGGTGAVWVTGGQLVATNLFGDIPPTSIGVISAESSLTQSGGTVEAFSEMVFGTLTVAGGTNIVGDGGLGVGAGGVTGTVWITGGQLIMTNALSPTGINVGSLIQSNGTVQMTEELVGDSDGERGTLIIAGGTHVVGDQGLQIGYSGGSGTVWVTGGQLVVTNAPTLVGDPGWGQMTVSNGTVTVSSLIVTNNTDGSIIFTNVFTLIGGVVNSGGAAITNGLVFLIGDGTDVATYHLLGGVHSFADGLRVRNNATLSGCGTINGNVVVDIGGTVLADCGGSLTFEGSVTNNGTMKAINGSILEAYGLVVNNGTIDITGGTTNFHAGFVNNGIIITPVAFQITGIAKQGSDIRVTWQSSIGSTNALQATAGDANGSYSTNNFAAIFTVTNTVGITTNYTDVGAATNFPARYYRIRLVP